MKSKPKIEWIYRGTGLWEGFVMVGPYPITVACIDGSLDKDGFLEFTVSLQRESALQSISRWVKESIVFQKLDQAKAFAARNAVYPEIPKRFDLLVDQVTNQFEPIESDTGPFLNAHEFFGEKP